MYTTEELKTELRRLIAGDTDFQSHAVHVFDNEEDYPITVSSARRNFIETVDEKSRLFKSAKMTADQKLNILEEIRNEFGVLNKKVDHLLVGNSARRAIMKNKLVKKAKK